MGELFTFIFPISELQQQVEKDTSYIGKMRNTENDSQKYDRLRLTEGEDFMFRDFLEQALAETYDWIKAFGRDVKRACRIIPDGVLHHLKENHGVRVLFGNEDKGMHFTMLLDGSVLEPSKPYATFEVVAETDKDVTYDVTLHSHLALRIGDAVNASYDVRVYYTGGVEDSPVTTKYIWSDSYIMNDDTSLDDLIDTFTVVLPKDEFGTHNIRSIDSIELEVTSITPADTTIIPKGDFVEYTHSNGKVVYLLLAYDYNPSMMGDIIADDIYETDLRNNVCIYVSLPDWSDRNMLPAVKTSLRKAICSYIIYLWFEMTNEKEAERYYAKFEDAAHQAQLGLNTENKTLERHGHWL